MKKANPNYKTRQLCDVFEVNPSSYYYEKTERSKADVELEVLMKVIFHTSGETYGKRRIYKALLALGHQVGIHKVCRCTLKKQPKNSNFKKFIFVPIFSIFKHAP